MVSSISFANWTGEWQGKGEMVSAQSPTPCDIIDLNLNQTDTTLSVLGGGWTCGHVKSEITPYNLTILNNKLYVGDVELGTIQSDQIHIFLKAESASQEYILKKTSDDTCAYEDTTFDRWNRPYFKVQGSLHKKQ